MSNPATIPNLTGDNVLVVALTERRNVSFHPMVVVMPQPADTAPATAIITAIEPWTYHGLLIDSYNLVAIGNNMYLGL